MIVKQVLRTDDPVKVSYAKSCLAEAGIEAFVMDQATASVFAGVFEHAKIRIMVIDEDEDEAVKVLSEALASWE
jgi:uncharacterized protein (DUF1786 family)